MKYLLQVFRLLLLLVSLSLCLLLLSEHLKGELDMVEPYGQGAAVVVWNADELDEAYWSRVAELSELSLASGKSFHILTCEQADERRLRSILPSNGGVVFYSDGVIGDRYPRRMIFDGRMDCLLASDADMAIADHTMKSRVALTAIFGILLLVTVIFHHIMRRRKLSK